MTYVCIYLQMDQLGTFMIVMREWLSRVYERLMLLLGDFFDVKFVSTCGILTC